jgi:hypothetical protein
MQVIVSEGEWRVSSMYSAGRGSLIIVVTRIIATAVFVLLFVELLDGAPSGTIEACRKSEWIQIDIHQMMQALC